MMLVKADEEYLKKMAEKNMSRAYRLNNGDVITINNIMLEYGDGMLYEVTFKGYGGLYSNPKWERTDRIFTMEEASEIL
ncbi:hypothetical protein GH892_03220 [Bacillus thuringiensis]|uniref:hypothetical protein n=1 Tax=Bacillus toyonensis TaxID=155322 RepID=UPI001298DD58|nr:hypothetical protein [Bacillus thuringiensis]